MRENRLSVFDFTALVDALLERPQQLTEEEPKRAVEALLRDWDRRFREWKRVTV